MSLLIFSSTVNLYRTFKTFLVKLSIFCLFCNVEEISSILSKTRPTSWRFTNVIMFLCGNARTGRPHAIYSNTLLGRHTSRCSLFFEFALRPAHPKSYCRGVRQRHIRSDGLYFHIVNPEVPRCHQTERWSRNPLFFFYLSDIGQLSPSKSAVHVQGHIFFIKGTFYRKKCFRESTI